MKNGDIGNSSAPVIAFNVDNLLFTDTKKETGISDKLIRLLSNKKEHDFFNRNIAENFRYFIHTLWNNGIYSIYMISMHPEYEEGLGDILNEKFDYTRLVCFDSIEKLRYEIDYYYNFFVDCDKNFLAKLGSPKGILISELKDSILRRR